MNPIYFLGKKAIVFSQFFLLKRRVSTRYMFSCATLALCQGGGKMWTCSKAATIPSSIAHIQLKNFQFSTTTTTSWSCSTRFLLLKGIVGLFHHQWKWYHSFPNNNKSSSTWFSQSGNYCRTKRQLWDWSPTGNVIRNYHHRAQFSLLRSILIITVRL